MADARRIHELVSSIVLDHEITLTASRDAYAICEASAATADQELAIARGEAFRQLQARNTFPHDVPIITVSAPDGSLADPIAGLTAMERATLALSVRFRVEDANIATILGINSREVAALLKTARRELARTAIAIALLTNPSRCPIINQAVTNLGNEITRGQAMNLVSHSAECSICVPVLRTVDRQIMQDYIDVPIADAPASVADQPDDVAALVARARLRDGWPPRDANLSRDPRTLLRRGVILGGVSAVLIVVALVLLAR